MSYDFILKNANQLTHFTCSLFMCMCVYHVLCVCKYTMSMYINDIFTQIKNITLIENIPNELKMNRPILEDLETQPLFL